MKFKKKLQVGIQQPIEAVNLLKLKTRRVVLLMTNVASMRLVSIEFVWILVTVEQELNVSLLNIDLFADVRKV